MYLSLSPGAAILRSGELGQLGTNFAVYTPPKTATTSQPAFTYIAPVVQTAPAPAPAPTPPPTNIPPVVQPIQPVAQPQPQPTATPAPSTVATTVYQPPAKPAAPVPAAKKRVWPWLLGGVGLLALAAAIAYAFTRKAKPKRRANPSASAPRRSVPRRSNPTKRRRSRRRRLARRKNPIGWNHHGGLGGNEDLGFIVPNSPIDADFEVVRHEDGFALLDAKAPRHVSLYPTRGKAIQEAEARQRKRERRSFKKRKRATRKPNPPALTAAQSRQRFADLKRAGCKPRRVTLPSGERAVVAETACARKVPRRPNLSTSTRAHLPAKDFAIPERRAYPIQSRAQAARALSFAEWPKNKRDRARVRRAVFARYPELKEKR